jgi:hypothetical protein
LSRMPMARSRRVTTARRCDHGPGSCNSGHRPKEKLGDLPSDPLRRRVGCDVDPDEIAAINPYNHEAVSPRRTGIVYLTVRPPAYAFYDPISKLPGWDQQEIVVWRRVSAALITDILRHSESVGKLGMPIHLESI